MGSRYFGEPYMGNDRASATGGSRKSKKSGSEKSKQPQRGLGVAQLEKIRLQGQMDGGGSFSSYGQFSYQYPSTPYPAPAFPQEDLRGQTAYSSMPLSSFSYTSSSAPSASHSFNPNFMMGIGGDYERQSATHASWGTSHDFLDMSSHVQPATASHLSNLRKEDAQAENHKRHRSSSMGSEANDAQEPDLELRLSL